MAPQSQPVSAAAPSAAGELAAAALLATLARDAGKPLIFRYEGRDVRYAQAQSGRTAECA